MSTIKRKRVKPTEDEEVGEFDISANTGMWETYAAQQYDVLQPINELFDNALAAILSAFLAIVSGNIYVSIDLEKGRGSIEHSGGATFPTDMKGLAECFMYGAKKRSSSLNEHGCGLKTSLAILDPDNSSWKLTIKKLNEDNELDYYVVQAPYQNKMQLKRTINWPGTNSEKRNGSIIEFPINKSYFKALYSSKSPKMSDIVDLHDRIKCHLAYMWMRVPELLDNRIRIYYNGDIVTPFKFNHDDVDEYVESKTRCDPIKMNEGRYSLDIEKIKLKKSAKKIPGTRNFKYAMDANGVYIYKNGRLIEAVNGNERDRKLYSRIFGVVPDPHHNGYIVIVNISGNQVDLPQTVPTKNRFKDGDLFNELIDKLHEQLRDLFPTRDHVSEAVDISKWKTAKENMLDSTGISYSIRQEDSYILPDGHRSPRIDIIETVNGVDNIYEFKAKVKPETEHIAQIFFNWIIAKQANPDKTIKPILMLRATDIKQDIPAIIISYLTYLKSMFNFDLTIRNTKNETLYPTSRI